MWQTIITIAIVAAAVLWAVWGLVRTLLGKKKGCGCGCEHCTCNSTCKSVDKIKLNNDRKGN